MDGKLFMLRKDLPQLLARVLGEATQAAELDAFLTFFDLTTTGTAVQVDPRLTPDLPQVDRAWIRA